jgi:hypothetical protein
MDTKRSGGQKVQVSPALIALAAVVMSFAFVSMTLAAAGPVIIYQPSSAGMNQMYVAGTKTVVPLASTEKMRNVVIGDIDGNGFDDEIVYTDATKGGLGYYKIPGNGVYTAANDHAIPNTPTDAIPMAVVRTSASGSTGQVVFKSASLGQAYYIRPDGTYRTALGKMDKAFALDVSGRGYAGDLVWWLSGTGMRWRQGLSGTDRKAPYTSWVPVGGGSILSGQPTRRIVFYATGMVTPTLYACDGSFNYTRIDGTTVSWMTNAGSLAFGCLDGDKVAEIILSSSTSASLQWYNAPTTGAPFAPSGIVTESVVKAGFGLRGVAMVDISGGTTPPPDPDPTPTTVTNLSEVKNLADGTSVTVNTKARTKLVREKSGTGITTTGFYIEEADRTNGIRVIGTTTATEGQLVAVKGTLGTNNGERVITLSGQTVSTLSSKVSAVSATIAGVSAMTGLLVQITGTLGTANLTSGTFNLSDGTRSVKVYCPDNTYTSGQATVTGCVGAEKDATTGAIASVVRVESTADVSIAATPPTPDPVNANYSVWTKSSMEKIYKTDAAQTLTSIALKAAKHEHEAFQIALRGKSTATSSITLTPGNLTGSAGTIAASNVQLFQTSFVPLQDFGVDYPDGLPPYKGAFNLAANATQPIWVDIYVPKTTAAGDYSGVITISDASGAKTNVPYTLHVYDFTLPDEWKCATSFGFRDDEMIKQHGLTYGTAAYQSMYKAYYEFQLTRGISPYNLPYGVAVMSDEGTKYLSDPRMSSFILPYSTDANWMKSAAAKYAQLGILGKAYFYVYDEPYTVDVFEQVKQTATYIHNCDPRLQTMITFSDLPRQTNQPSWASGKSYAVGEIAGHAAQAYYYGNYLFKCKVAHTSSSTTEPAKGANWQQYWSRVTHFDYLKDYIDVWCIGSGVVGLIENEINERRAAGDMVWTYNWYGVARNGGITPTIEPRLQSWLGYRYNAPGMLWWCANFWSGCPNPWTNLKNTPSAYCEGVLYYPGAQVGVSSGVSSIRMEMVRDSLEDYQYLWLLEQKQGRAAVMNYVSQLVTSYTSYTQDASKVASVRDQIANAIEP